MSLLKTCKNGTGNLLGIFKDIGTSAPAEFRVFPEGEIFNENDSLPVYMNKESAEIVISHFESLGHDMVVDYEHQTLEGVQAPAAGWVTKIEYRDGDGLYVHTEWTEKAVQYIEKREYRYF
ncbi:MAG: hypothetical protein GY749_29450, partial [Desulfobacteraceae bacterium]|nr:hypothetical protein [Desulfobacteraceae bacterium]